MAQDIKTKIDDQLAPPREKELPGVEDVAQRAAATLEILESLQREIEHDEEVSLGPARPDLRLPGDFLLSIVVPVFNEKDTISAVVGRLLALSIPAEVIIVDDGSTDGTCAVLTQLNQQHPQLRVVFQEFNQGKGAALRSGFSLASGSHVMIQDADLEYDPRDIPKLLEPFGSGNVDVVYGSRFLEDRHRGSSFIHRLGNRLLTSASNLVTGWRLTDMETCYKVFRRDLLEQLTFEQDGFGFEVELTSKLASQGARVLERPISYDARSWQEGKKISWKDGLHALYCILKYR